MTRGIFFDHGDRREPKTRFAPAASSAVPAYATLDVYPGENIGSITQRAYGANTPALRRKIEKANRRLEGTIRVPR